MLAEPDEDQIKQIRSDHKSAADAARGLPLRGKNDEGER
jgi:hypothetical protein